MKVLGPPGHSSLPGSDLRHLQRSGESSDEEVRSSSHTSTELEVSFPLRSLSLTGNRCTVMLTGVLCGVLGTPPTSNDRLLPGQVRHSGYQTHITHTHTLPCLPNGPWHQRTVPPTKHLLLHRLCPHLVPSQSPWIVSHVLRRSGPFSPEQEVHVLAALVCCFLANRPQLHFS